MGVVLTRNSPIRVSLPRFHYRVGLHIVLFEVCSAFTRVAACTLARSPYVVTAIRRLQTLRLLHVCSGRFRLERSPGGLAPTGKAPPCQGERGERPFPICVPLKRSALRVAIRRCPCEPSVTHIFNSPLVFGIRLGTRRPRSGRTLRSLPVPEPRADPARIAAGNSLAHAPELVRGLLRVLQAQGSAAGLLLEISREQRARMGWPHLPVTLRPLRHED